MAAKLTEKQKKELELDINAFMCDGRAVVYIHPIQYEEMVSWLETTNIEHSLAVHLWHRPHLKDLFERCRVAIREQAPGAVRASLREIALQWEAEGKDGEYTRPQENAN